MTLVAGDMIEVQVIWPQYISICIYTYGLPDGFSFWRDD
jgi:hypothetical protein